MLKQLDNIPRDLVVRADPRHLENLDHPGKQDNAEEKIKIMKCKTF